MYKNIIFMYEQNFVDMKTVNEAPQVLKCLHNSNQISLEVDSLN